MNYVRRGDMLVDDNGVHWRDDRSQRQIAEIYADVAAGASTIVDAPPPGPQAPDDHAAVLALLSGDPTQIAAVKAQSDAAVAAKQRAGKVG